jgi:single-stranded-DNA-specific exonuclease
MKKNNSNDTNIALVQKILNNKKEIIIRETNKELFQHHYKNLKKTYLATILAKRNIEHYTIPDLNNLTDTSNYESFHSFQNILEDWILNNPEKIILHSDYDSDGINSAYIFKNFCRMHYNKDIATTLNLREEGYGITIEVVKKIYNQGYRLLITADNGIAACEPVKYAKELGMTVLITDHHFPKKKKDGTQDIPKADLVINNRTIGNDIYEKEWCGAGIIFFLMKHINKEIAFRFLDSACVATIGDMVSIKDQDNYIIAYFGLKNLNNQKYSTKNYADLIETILPESKSKKISEVTIGFEICPVINAANRLCLAHELMEDLNKEISPNNFQKYIVLNNERKELTIEYHAKLNEDIINKGLLKNKFLVLYRPDIPEGIIGILASRFEKSYGRPVIVFTNKSSNNDDTENNSSEMDLILKGSGRSSTFNLQNIFEEAFPLKDKVMGGGHEGACGLVINKNDLQNFQEVLNEYSISMNKIYVDGVLNNFDIINEKVYSEFELLAPFGMENNRPLFLFNDLKINNIGIMKDAHIKLSLIDDTKKIKTDMIMFSFKDNISFKNSYTIPENFDVNLPESYSNFSFIGTMQKNNFMPFRKKNSEEKKEEVKNNIVQIMLSEIIEK